MTKVIKCKNFFSQSIFFFSASPTQSVSLTSVATLAALEAKKRFPSIHQSDQHDLHDKEEDELNLSGKMTKLNLKNQRRKHALSRSKAENDDFDKNFEMKREFFSHTSMQSSMTSSVFSSKPAFSSYKTWTKQQITPWLYSINLGQFSRNFIRTPNKSLYSCVSPSKKFGQIHCCDQYLRTKKSSFNNTYTMTQKLPKLSPSVRNWQELDNQNWTEKPIFLTHHTFHNGDNANYIYQRIRTHFKCQNGDIYLVTYPKEGTTWTCSILERLNQLEVNGKILDSEKVKINLGLSKNEIAPWLECLADGEDYLENFRFLENKKLGKERRYFKTHSPITLLPNLDPKRPLYQKSSEIENFKIISIFRNPLDQMVSHWHHTVGKKHFAYNGTFEEFFELCLNPTNDRNNGYKCGGRLSQNGDWFLYHEEILKFWVDNRNREKIILETYENLQKDEARNFIKNLAKFINLKSDLLKDDEDTGTCISKISELCNFKSMKKVQKETGFSHKTDLTSMMTDKIGNKNDASSAHIREGKVGGWNSYYTEDMLERWEEHVESKRESCPLMFEYLGKEYLCGETFETRLDFNYL